MKRILYLLKSVGLIFVLTSTEKTFGQTFEWRLNNVVYSSVDPDGVGPATGSVTFKLQIHTTTGSVSNITQIVTGYSYQSAKAMIPSSAVCTSSSTPSNISISPEFTVAGFLYTVVNQCNTPTLLTSSGQLFDKRAIGTIDVGAITIGTTWVDVFTVTLWALGSSNPQAGYAIIQSSEGGSPGEFTTYSISNSLGVEYASNSLSYATPLPLGSGALPITLTKFDAQCQPNKSASVTWSTAQEINNKYFEIEKSSDAITWSSLNKVNASGNSSVQKNYQITDAQGGAAFYRLKQVDVDGKISYSSVVKTSCEGKAVFVNLYPVPARDVVNLIVGSDKAIKTNLQVFDNKGRLVINKPVSITNGINNFNLQVQHLAAGEYLIRSSDNGIEINKRFTVVR